MTATDELRRLLDDRGVEYTQANAMGGTLFIVVTSEEYYFILVRDNNAGIEMWSKDLTPEQAVAATLGRGTCHDASIGHYREYGTRFTCSECGATVELLDDQNEPIIRSNGVGMHPRFCPACGRAVVEHE